MRFGISAVGVGVDGDAITDLRSEFLQNVSEVLNPVPILIAGIGGEWVPGGCR